MFVSLHNHSEYSSQDAIPTITEYVEAAERLGIDALTINDHGTLAGVYDLLVAQTKTDVRLIPGIEAYAFVGEPSRKTIGHITLTAPNQRAFEQLIKLHGESSKRLFNGSPALELPMLLEREYEDIVVSTACMKSIFLIDNSLFPAFAERKNFYVEFMNHYIPGEDEAMRTLLTLGTKYDVPVIATNDAHYIRPEDGLLHSKIKSIAYSKQITMDTNELYLKDKAALFKAIGEEQWIENSKLILKNYEKLRLPELPPQLPVIDGSKEILKREAKIFLERLDDKNQPVYKKRLKYEMEQIFKYGFDSYFAFLYELIKEMKSKGIKPGHGRGSAAGSLLSYVLGITGIDPLKFDLKFERFLNPGRIKVKEDGTIAAKDFPDIDLDIPDNRRKEVFEMFKKKFGEDNVSRVGTVIRYQPKLALRDSLRYFGITPARINQLLKECDPFADSIDKLITPDIASILKKYDNGELAKALEGRVRTIGIHACGVIVSDHARLLPRRWDSDSEVWATEFDLDAVQELNYVKFDILGLKELSRRQEMLDQITRLTGKNLTLRLNDKRIYDAISKGSVTGVFQLGSYGMRQTLKEIGVANFGELSDAVALFRPGAKEFIPQYAKAKRTRKMDLLGVKEVDDVLRQTHGVLIYQEQVLEIFANFGFSLSEADSIRRAIGKKKADLMESFKEKFRKKVLAKGYTEDIADKVWGWIDAFSGYGFNKSHSVSYALHSLKDAAIKVRYPNVYYASLMNYAKDAEELSSFLFEWGIRGPIVTPRFTLYSENFKPLPSKEILYGLKGIKGFSEKKVEKILEVARGIPYEQVQRLKEIANPIERMSSLMLAGYGSLPNNIKNILAVIGFFGPPELTLGEDLKDLMLKQTEILGFPVSPLTIGSYIAYKEAKDDWEYQYELLPVYVLSERKINGSYHLIIKYPFEGIFRIMTVDRGISYVPGTKILWQPKKAPRKTMPRISVGHVYENGEWVKVNQKGVEKWMN